MSRASSAETFTAVFRKEARVGAMHGRALGQLEALVADMRRYLDSTMDPATVLRLVGDRVEEALGVSDAVKTVTHERLAFLEQTNASTSAGGGA
jgi:hypothetical protein